MSDPDSYLESISKRDRYGITALAVSTLLFLALSDWPAGYYQFLRLAACAFSAVVAYRAYRTDKIGWLLFSLAGAILFNPIVPIEMEKDDWVFPDVAFGTTYAVYGLLHATTTEERRKWAPRIAIALACIAAAIGLSVWLSQRRTDYTQTAEAGYQYSPTVPTPSETATPPPSPAEELAEAFEAATGHRTTFKSVEDGQAVTTAPIEIVQLPFGPALLTRNQGGDFHAAEGSIGVYYLKKDGGSISVVGSWPKAVTGWGWGKPPEDWSITYRFTDYPAIFASGGYAGMGIATASSSLTELRPEGPTTSDLIWTGFSNEGAGGNEQSVCAVSGKITSIRKDRAFDVVMSGSLNAVDHYVKRHDRFVSLSNLDHESPCPSPQETTETGAE